MARYVGRCLGCGQALFVSGRQLYSMAAGKPRFRCGMFRRDHKRRVAV